MSWSNNRSLEAFTAMATSAMWSDGGAGVLLTIITGIRMGLLYTSSFTGPDSVVLTLTSAGGGLALRQRY